MGFGDILGGAGDALGGLANGAGNILGGITGSKWSATGVPLENPTGAGEIANAGAQAQSGLAQQQAFVNALNAQNGIGNQSNVFNQLQGVASGTGPNPAQAMLNQATAANVANQASLMASQRGAGANPGMIARMAAQQGGNLQQQAAGQGATMQANQSLGALNQMGGIAGQQVQNQGQAVQGYGQMAQNEQQNLLNAQAQYNNAQVGQQNNQNTVNAGIQSGNAQRKADLIGGVMKGAGSAAGLAAAAEGGMATPQGMARPHSEMMMAEGGPVSSFGRMIANTPSNNAPMASFGGNDAFAQPQAHNMDPGLKGMRKPAASNNDIVGGSSASPMTVATGGQGAMPAGMESGAGFAAAAHGGQARKAVPALVSPGERYLPPQAVKQVAEGKANPMQAGEKIKGKAKVNGDSYSNDTVQKVLASGGIVIPRHITQSKNAPKLAADFVRAILAKQGLK